MFIQVIQGRISDRDEVKAALEQWVRELAPRAVGWLGTTAGVTEDGQFIALARFESEDAARRNSDSREQDQWWTQTSKLFTEEPRFLDSTNVVLDLVGDPDTAGFVQVIQGRSNDPERARELMTQDSAEWAAFRPDVLGSVAVEHADGAYTMALYFTSEQEAREGERKEMPERLQAQMAEMNDLTVGEASYLDLEEPWLYATGR